jgi:hypothetical protein
VWVFAIFAVVVGVAAVLLIGSSAVRVLLGGALDFVWAFATGAVVALVGLGFVLVMPETLGRGERASA